MSEAIEMIKFEFGKIGCGKSEWQRIQLGMSHEEYNEAIRKQAHAHARLIAAERELRDAKAEYFASCVIRKPTPTPQSERP